MNGRRSSSTPGTAATITPLELPRISSLHFLSHPLAFPHFTPPQLSFSFHFNSHHPTNHNPNLLRVALVDLAPHIFIALQLPRFSTISKMADQRMTWDHDADKALLGCMQDEIVPTQDQLRGVMNRMHAQGYTCTVKAITY